MPRLTKIAALVTAFGCSLGLAATLVAGQPAGAGPVFFPPDDITAGQKICIIEDVGGDDVPDPPEALDEYDIDIKISGEVCVPASPDAVYVKVSHNI